MTIADSIMNKMISYMNSADQEAAAEVVNQLRHKYPKETADQLCDRLIRAKCLKTGSVGAVTSGSALVPGVGTVASMTFGVAADLTLTFKHQAELVLEIANLYGHQLTETEKRRIILAVTGVGPDLCRQYKARSIPVAARPWRTRF